MSHQNSLRADDRHCSLGPDGAPSVMQKLLSNIEPSLTRMENTTPLTKQMANHLSLVLKLRDEASRILRRKGMRTCSRRRAPSIPGTEHGRFRREPRPRPCHSARCGVS